MVSIVKDNVNKCQRFLETNKQIFRELLSLFHDLLFPEFCIGCGTCGTVLCSECFGNIELTKTFTCFYCSKIVEQGKLCPACNRKHGPAFEGIIWASSYKDPIVKELVHEYKYNGVIAAGEIIAEMLRFRSDKWIRDIGDAVVVPVPIHFNKLKRRGFNQAEYLAVQISKAHGLSGGLALRRVRETTTQVGLSKAERQRNLSGAIVCDDVELIYKRNVILIDDVATTGATLSACAKVLKASGAKKVYAAVVARG